MPDRPPPLKSSHGPSALDDPMRAAPIWAHYRRMLRLAGDVSLGVIGIVWVYLYHLFGLVSIHLYIATALGIGATIMLMAALMGLVFLSNASGHDDAIEDRLEDETWK
ncbi:hypothetical protein [Novosphingobium sp. FKTRR1]|uniref:hypothetical protein n=1 Tax=unclassified Novosphingobium TaxID=2644732 RepID=UPI001CF071C5|nr:hypothetical protein [Novosphingobium sp. FKTRR1]